MANIFLSWSGKRSREMASFLYVWLRKVIQKAKPWMSDSDIEKGQRWFIEIGENLNSHNIGIICVTPENYKAPWLLFEAGALSKAVGSSKVCPLLLGISPSELDGPLREFQATVLTKEDVFKLVKTLDAELGEWKTPYLEEAFEAFWPEFEEKISEISKIEIAGSNDQISRVINSFARHGLPEPLIGSQVYFSSGFESHSLYTVLTNVVQNRLLIFGRKNRKLFDKEHRDFFKTLKERVDNGFDFRVLFLNPNAPLHILRAAHQDDDLKSQIEICIKRAKEVLENVGLDPENHIRIYNIHRTVTSFIVDDAVVYSPITLDENGRAKRLTKAPFSVLNLNTELGKELHKSFESVWENGKMVSS
ncbi:TIR domain-containing protein [Nitrosophilus alvini]|uniref:TIR domain-containing protein n=1 Tax=Nitrosophilus alvini TaxID=2714855 RepID=UPI0022778960|nr:TIR domain-containing protein [Nitrosophilus alvini]